MAVPTMQSKKRLQAITLFLVLIIMASFIALSLSTNLKRSSEVNGEIIDLEREIANLERDNLEFRELIEYFNSNAYIEERARVDLGLKKDGEKVVVITNAAATGTAIAHVGTESLGALTNPQKWWHYFFN